MFLNIFFQFQGDSGGPLHCPIDNPSDYESISVKTEVNLPDDKPINFIVCGHTSHNGDLARMNFRLKNDNTIDLDYPCALQNTLVFGL